VKPIFFLFNIIVFSHFVVAQNNPQAQNSFINQDAQQVIDDWNIKYPTLEFHSSFKPYLSSSLNQFSDTAIPFLHYPIKNFFLSKTFNEGPSKRNQFQLQVLPIVDLQAGYDVLEKRMLFETSGGAHLKLNIKVVICVCQISMIQRCKLPSCYQV
jgi:hypothetical protein